MLSYRHAFHAGNFADVLKHLVQVETLTHLQKKDKPFIYIDTHAGAGIYSLDSNQAQKTAEHVHGISAIRALEWPELKNYLQVAEQLNEMDGQTNLYPGSPAIAQAFLREQDRAILFELHPSDYLLLEEFTHNDRRIRVNKSDGFQGLIATVPPTIKRGLVLIDPSYEIKSDYDDVVEVLIATYRRFATATYALWYPVVDRERVNTIEEGLKASGIKNIQQFELGLKPDSLGHGMTAAGMIVINPPYTLKSNLEKLLPKLSKHLSGAKGVWRSHQLVEE